MYPLAFDGRADYETESVPSSLVQRELSTPGGHYLTTSNFAQFALYFNERYSPLGSVNVRQALAYLVDRPQILALQDGGHSPHHWIRYPDGLLSSVEREYLSASQIRSLNPYHYDRARATQLLKNAGLRKTSSGWVLPDGKPFTLTIGTPSGWGGEELFGKVATKLTSFGIKTTSTAVEQPGYWTDQTKGDYQLDWGWGVNGELDPLSEFADVLGSQDFATSTERGLSFGPVEDVPGLGRVNLHNTILQEAASRSSTRSSAHGSEPGRGNPPARNSSSSAGLKIRIVP